MIYFLAPNFMNFFGGFNLFCTKLYFTVVHDSNINDIITTVST